MIPETNRLHPRPVWARYLWRLQAPHELLPPTRQEIQDAHLVLSEGPIYANGLPDPLYIEAVKILEEANI